MKAVRPAKEPIQLAINFLTFLSGPIFGSLFATAVGTSMGQAKFITSAMRLQLIAIMLPSVTAIVTAMLVFALAYFISRIAGNP